LKDIILVAFTYVFVYALSIITFNSASYTAPNGRAVTKLQTGKDAEENACGPVWRNCLKKHRKVKEILIQNGQTPGRDLNPEPPEGVAGVLPGSATFYETSYFLKVSGDGIQQFPDLTLTSSLHP
jgi:hypothetical protein